MKKIAFTIFIMMVMFGCQASKPPVVKAETITTAKESPPPPPMVQDNDPAEIAECVRRDLSTWKTYLSGLTKDCEYDANLDATIVITSYRSGVIDGWHAGFIQATKMKLFGVVGFSQHYPFSKEDTDALQKTLSEEMQRGIDSENAATKHKESLAAAERCVNSEVRTYLYDLGYNCGVSTTTELSCANYRNSFMKVCNAARSLDCRALLVKSQPEFCK